MKITNGLIARYIAGECQPEEIEAVDRWRSESAENEKFFTQMRESWLLSGDTSSIIVPDRESLWESVAGKAGISKKEKPIYSRAVMIQAAAIAAVVVFALTSFIFLSIGNRNTPYNDMLAKSSVVTVISPPGQKTVIILPDSTRVWLNSGTTLSYSTDYGRYGRDVELNGEAFFDVARDPASMFRVHAGDICVRVYGTQFNIHAFETDGLYEVSLLEGHVDVVSADNDMLYGDLAPNKKLVFDRESLEPRIVACDAEREGIWRYGQLKIEWEPITEVILKMERWYGVNIDLDPTENKELYWLTIKTESLTEMLEFINRITPIKYTINGEEVKIDYR